MLKSSLEWIENKRGERESLNNKNPTLRLKTKQVPDGQICIKKNKNQREEEDTNTYSSEKKMGCRDTS